MTEREARATVGGLALIIGVVIAALIWGPYAALIVLGLDSLWLLWTRAGLLVEMDNLRASIATHDWQITALAKHQNVILLPPVEDDSPGHEQALMDDAVTSEPADHLQLAPAVASPLAPEEQPVSYADVFRTQPPVAEDPITEPLPIVAPEPIGPATVPAQAVVAQTLDRITDEEWQRQQDEKFAAWQAKQAQDDEAFMAHLREIAGTS